MTETRKPFDLSGFVQMIRRGLHLAPPQSEREQGAGEYAVYLSLNGRAGDQFAPGAVQLDPERFPHAMVDIETMSNHTSRSLILSVAAIPFALEADGPRFGPSMLLLPELSEQLASGRLVTGDTQEFWRKAGPKARKHWNGPRDRMPAWSVAGEIRLFLARNTTGKAAQVWFRGQGFDPGNLDNLATEHDCQPPFPFFWMLRDQRTATTFFPKQRSRPEGVVIDGDPHDPIRDCREQIWALWEHAPAETLGLPPAADRIGNLADVTVRAAAMVARAAAEAGLTTPVVGEPANGSGSDHAKTRRA